MISFLITLIIFWGHVLGFWGPTMSYSSMGGMCFAELTLEAVALAAWAGFKS